MECQAPGLLRIEALTPAAVRTVRPRLSDGRTIVSAVVRVPEAPGGSAADDGLYVQALRGPKPIPLSLVGLDAAVKVSRRVKLIKVRGCTGGRNLAEGPISATTVARGRVPHGPRFTVQVEEVRENGKLEVLPDVSALQAGSAPCVLP